MDFMPRQRIPNDGPKPPTTKEDREKRNHKIMAMFIAGNSERAIGAAVGITGQRVHQIIKAEMKNAARHRELLTDEALGVYQERIESLLQAVWPLVQVGEVKAIAEARQLLQQQARLYGLEGTLGMPSMPAMPGMNVDDEPEQLDELAEYRLRNRRRRATAQEDDEAVE